MPPRKRRSSSAEINQSVLSKTTDLLQNLPDKSLSDGQEQYNLREAVKLLQTPIVSALEKGYSYEEIAAFLAQKKIEIAPASLRFYVAALRREESSGNSVKTTATKTTATKTTAPRHHSAKASKEMRLTSIRSPRTQVSKAGAVISFLLGD